MSILAVKDVTVVMVPAFDSAPWSKTSGPNVGAVGATILKGGQIVAVQYAAGYSPEAVRLKAELAALCLDRLLAPTSTALFLASVLPDRVRDFANSKTGRNSKGAPYAASKFLRKLADAHEAGRAAFQNLPKQNYTLRPAIMAATAAAKEGLEEARGLRSFLNTVFATEEDYLLAPQDAKSFSGPVWAGLL